jgi:hypothetical protein
MGLSAIALTPPGVVGSMPVAGTATLECKAAPGPIRVDLSSSMAAAARPVAAYIFVPQGLQSAPFDVATFPVAGKVSVSIAGTANGILKSKLLTVSPAAAVSPASLAFDYQKVNTTSWVQVAILYNKGAAPFAVSGIGLTGTSANQYAQSNNCPGVLPAGSYCTIGVTFKPTATGSKTAKLAISTSATAAALNVSLSGTGY